MEAESTRELPDVRESGFSPDIFWAGTLGANSKLSVTEFTEELHNEEFARGLKDLGESYLAIIGRRQEGYECLKNYISSIRRRLGLEESTDMVEDLRAIDAEIDRLKALEGEVQS